MTGYREPIRYAEDGPAAVSRAISLGPYAVQRYRGPAPAERVKAVQVPHEAVVREKARVERAHQAKAEKKKATGAKERRKVYANDAERKAAARERRLIRLHGSVEAAPGVSIPKGSKREGWTPPNKIYASVAERLEARKKSAREKYRLEHPKKVKP
jgi:hypothetical protein